MTRSVPAHLATLLIGALVVVFIVLPIGAMLVRSLRVDGPVPPARLHALTEQALALLPADQRTATVARWVAAATPAQRMEAVAAALTLAGHEVAWDRSAAYDTQIAAAEAALAALPTDERARVEAAVPDAVVMLHRRTPLAFKVRDRLDPEAFDTLRTGRDQGWGPDQYLAVVADPRLRHAAANSLTIAATTTVLVTGLAFLAAFGINRGVVAGAAVARYGLLVPLVSPPVVIATAAVLLFGRNGLVTHGLLDRGLGLIDAGVTNLYGLSGVVLAQVLSYVPPAFIVLDNLMARQDGRLDEAAASQGATAWQTFREVTLPMAQPGLIRAAILVFILSMTDFGNPLVVGRDIPVLAGVLYDEMVGFHNTPLASAIAVWLIVPALCVYALLDRIGRRKRFETDALSEPPALPFPRGAALALTALVWTLIAVTAVIYGTIVVGAFVTVWGQDFTFTPHHFTAVEAVPGFVSEYVGVTPVWTSVAIAGVAAPVGGVLAVALAWLAERQRSAATEAIGFAVMLPAILPGVVFGIGYIVAFNNPLGIPALALTGTPAILVLNILFGNMFVGVLAGRALLRRVDPAIDEAAEILGASLLQRFLLVTLPVMRRAMLLGSLYVFVDGMTTFSAVVFLEGPDLDLASVAIFQTASSAYYGAACAMSTTILAIVFAVMAVLWGIERAGLRRGAALRNAAA